ncbi:MAG: sulfatase-like hydrolase/transferase [Anaerolineales bacterium]|nr:sulfatase-like hydrolase/transferase [Anaerolineales bacterium]
MRSINRREFLKLIPILSGALFSTANAVKNGVLKSTQDDLLNVVIFVFDALSASNMSIYGYQRDTTPNLTHFAQHANIYHSHYSGGSFTTSGTASLMTGTYPWTHRALNLFGLIERDLTQNNIFNVIGAQYERIAFSQNLLPNLFLEQFPNDLEVIMNPASFSLTNYLYGSIFKNDRKTSYRAQDFLALEEPTVLSHSLVFGPFINYLLERKRAAISKENNPLGIPQVKNGAFLFTLENLMNGIGDNLESSTGPYMHYYHIMAPHEPYRPDGKFYDRYNKDDFSLVKKPRAKFDTGYKQVRLDNNRKIYDAYIANIDDEFGRLLDRMERNGIFENSYVIITSDHGEMFERGIEGHLSSHLYEPGIHIPLLISAPGQKARKDIYTPTNSVDILPTISHNIHGTVPDWSEGKILPGLGGMDDLERSIFTVEAKSNSAFRPLTNTTIAMRKGNYKIVHYTGYKKVDDFFELYDIQNDPEELNDLYPSNPSISQALKEELLDTLQTQNKDS